MSRLWCIAPLLVGGLLSCGFLMGDDRRTTIVVRATLPRYYSQLGLTPKQRNAVYKVREKYRAEIQELYEKINDLREQERSACEKVLTAAQKKRLRELLVGKQGADDEDEPVKVEKKKGAVAKGKKKDTEAKDKKSPGELNKPVEIKK